MGLDQDEDFDQEDQQKIILIPGDMHDKLDAKSGTVKFKSSGSIASAIEEVRSNNIVTTSFLFVLVNKNQNFQISWSHNLERSFLE